MTAVVQGLLVAALGLVVVLGVIVRGLPRRPALGPAVPDPPADWFERAVARKVIVHAEARSIEGIVAFVGPDGVLLRSAQLLGPQPTPLAGEVWVPRGQVLFVQTVP